MKQMRHINTRSYESSPNRWVPKAEVFWNEGADTTFEILETPKELFKDLEQADNHAIQIATAWVDERIANI